MKNEIMSMQNVIDIGNAFYTSGCFTDVKSAAQAIVKIQAGQELGILPFASMTGIHLIQGKATIGGHLIAAQIKASDKYDYQVIERSNERCEIEFFEGKKKLGKIAFTAQDAARAGTQNMTKYPSNMLFNRAISNGYKTYCPDVFMAPVYTPEEFDQSSVEVEGEATTATPEQAAQSEPAKIIELPVLSKSHESFGAMIEWMKKGGTVEALRSKYQISNELANEMVNLAKPDPAMTTQTQIHEDNKQEPATAKRPF